MQFYLLAPLAALVTLGLFKLVAILVEKRRDTGEFVLAFECSKHSVTGN